MLRGPKPKTVRLSERQHRAELELLAARRQLRERKQRRDEHRSRDDMLVERAESRVIRAERAANRAAEAVAAHTLRAVAPKLSRDPRVKRSAEGVAAAAGEGRGDRAPKPVPSLPQPIRAAEAGASSPGLDGATAAAVRTASRHLAAGASRSASAGARRPFRSDPFHSSPHARDAGDVLTRAGAAVIIQSGAILTPGDTP